MGGTYTYEYPRPMVTVDTVLFRFAGGAVETLLVKRREEPHKGRWAFPGGFISMDERLIDAAARELREETGIENIMLEPFGTFDAPDRDPRGRVISVAHIGLICGQETVPRPGDDAEEAGWFPVAATPDLAFDHSQVLEAALYWLAARLGLNTEEPRCFLTMTPEEQAAVRGCLAEAVQPRKKTL